MDIKIILYLALLVTVLGCKKDCRNVETKRIAFTNPAANWADSMEKNVPYNYYFKSAGGPSDIVRAYHYEKLIHGEKIDCEFRERHSQRMVFESQNYFYRFELHVDDTDGDAIGELQMDYTDNIKYLYDLFKFFPDDSSKNQVRLYYSSSKEILAPGHVSLLPQYTNSAGLTFNNVFRFSNLSAEQGTAKPAMVKIFYATIELGLIEYTTISGITFSYYKREKL